MEIIENYDSSESYSKILALESNLVDKIYLTKVHHVYDGDTFFPELGKDWKEVERIDCKADEKHAHDYSFLTFEKIN